MNREVMRKKVKLESARKELVSVNSNMVVVKEIIEESFVSAELTQKAVEVSTKLNQLLVEIGKEIKEMN